MEIVPSEVEASLLLRFEEFIRSETFDKRERDKRWREIAEAFKIVYPTLDDFDDHAGFIKDAVKKTFTADERKILKTNTKTFEPKKRAKFVILKNRLSAKLNYWFNKLKKHMFSPEEIINFHNLSLEDVGRMSTPPDTPKASTKSTPKTPNTGASSIFDSDEEEQNEEPNDMEEEPNDMEEEPNDFEEEQNDIEEEPNDMEEEQYDIEEEQNYIEEEEPKTTGGHKYQVMEKLDRENNDAYYTPWKTAQVVYAIVVKMIDEYIPSTNSQGLVICDPMGGAGALLKPFAKAHYITVHKDLYAEKAPIKEDYLESTNHNYDIMVTNPPFNLKQEVFAKALEVGKPFAMILPTSCLAMVGMSELFQSTKLHIYHLVGSIAKTFIKASTCKKTFVGECIVVYANWGFKENFFSFATEDLINKPKVKLIILEEKLGKAYVSDEEEDTYA